MHRPWPDLEWSQGAGLYIAIPYMAARMPDRPLRVLDVGGSFGAHGMISAKVFPEFPLTWAVVESPAFAKVAGPVETNSLRVFSNTEDAVDWLGGGVDLVHSSGTLQYLEDPDEAARDLASVGAPFMLWQRTAFAHKDRVVVVQTSRLSDNGMGPLPPEFKDRTVAYPATYVTEHELLAACEGYRVVLRVPSSEPLHGGLGTFGTVLLLSNLPDSAN